MVNTSNSILIRRIYPNSLEIKIPYQHLSCLILFSISGDICPISKYLIRTILFYKLLAIPTKFRTQGAPALLGLLFFMPIITLRSLPT